MNKKYLIIVLSFLMIIAGSTVAYLYFQGNEKTDLEDREHIELLKSIINKEGETSLQLIDQALAKGEINKDTAMVYKIYAIFGDDEKLPDEYKSEKAFFTSNYEILKIKETLETLSPEARAKIEPYLKRPDDPESYWNQKFEQEAINGTEGQQSNSLIPAAKAMRAKVYTESLVSADEKVRIWYPKADMSSKDIFGAGNVSVSASKAKSMAEKVKGYLDDDEIIQDYVDLMDRELISDGNKGGDGKLDIYIAPIGSDLGACYLEGSLPNHSYILLNITISNDKVLRTTLAHELFHSFQYLYKHDWDREYWYSEATAVWSEDYIYMADDTERVWLDKFIPYAEVSVDDMSPPENHHYGAYIFPFFLTDQFGDNIIRESWEKSESTSCIKGIDEILEGGLKEHWKKFTLWNYNKEPARKYLDYYPFPLISSETSKVTEDVFLMIEETEIDIGEINPLAADISIAHNGFMKDSDIKRLVFKNLDKFTSKTDKASIKALIYYKDGRKVIEDWTKETKRGFCIANVEEDFDKVVLIFSNADLEDNISKSQIKVEGKKSCYHVKQRDDRTSVLHFPYADQGAMKITDIGNTIEVYSDGEMASEAKEGQEYAYLTDWKVKYEFEQIREAFSFDCRGTSVDYGPGWTTRSAGYLMFNLNQDELNDDGTFSIDMSYGEPHPHGNYEDIPNVDVKCGNLFFAAMQMDLSGFKGTYKDIYRGKLLDMDKEGALIEIKNSCLYHDCTTQQGQPFQTISEPILLEIKRTHNTTN